jgi:hypothetical protein
MRKFISFFVFIALFAGQLVSPGASYAQRITPTATPSPTLTETPSPTPVPDLTEKTEETLGPLEALLEAQKLGPVWPFNPVKYAIRGAVEAGVPANTLVLLLLLPVVAAIIAAARHVVGLRGFGIFLPAALAVTFVATGPLVGIGLFLAIVAVSVAARMVLRKTKVKLQYLPRMAILLWLVVLAVLGILFAAPIIKMPQLTKVSIFPVLILALLAEDFTRVQLGKSAETAINLTSETLVLALVSYLFLTLTPLQKFALLNPEILLVSVFILDFILGKYVGLRLMEFWRFRKLIKS